MEPEECGVAPEEVPGDVSTLGAGLTLALVTGLGVEAEVAVVGAVPTVVLLDLKALLAGAELPFALTVAPEPPAPPEPPEPPEPEFLFTVLFAALVEGAAFVTVALGELLGLTVVGRGPEVPLTVLLDAELLGAFIAARVVLVSSGLGGGAADAATVAVPARELLLLMLAVLVLGAGAAATWG